MKLITEEYPKVEAGAVQHMMAKFQLTGEAAAIEEEKGLKLGKQKDQMVELGKMLDFDEKKDGNQQTKEELDKLKAQHNKSIADKPEDNCCIPCSIF